MAVFKEFRTHQGYSIVTFKKHQDAQTWRANISDPMGKFKRQLKGRGKDYLITRAERFIDNLIKQEEETDEHR